MACPKFLIFSLIQGVVRHVRQLCVMMNEAVTDKEDDPPFEVVMRSIVARYGVVRVMMGALRQMRPRPAPVPLVLNAHLRRDVGLPPDGGP